jgi:uncharacterized repeat protein (TIGR01451 family)
MKIKNILTYCMAAVFMSASATFATTLATWTFETSQPGVVTLPASPGAGVYLTNITAEVPSGTASGLHAGASTYSSPAGNGSSHSFSSQTWAVGDFYQFAVSTVGYNNILVSFDQVASSTGPGRFYLAYSTDGVTFTQFGSIYNVTNTPSWSTINPGSAAESFSFNLSSITAINNASLVYFRLVDANTTSSAGGTTASGGTCRVDNFSVSTLTAPVISSSPSPATVNAGLTASFTVTLSDGTPPFTYFWYKGTVSPANLISTVATNVLTSTLTLPNVLQADAANYQVVVSNSTAINATSDPAALTVIDPAINVQPVSQSGLTNGTVQFFVTAGGTGLNYQWYFCTSPSDNTQKASAVGASLPSGSSVSGATSSALTINNLHTSDPTNFVVVVTGTYGSVTSSVASLQTVANTGTLAFWTFNGTVFNVTNPAPYQGIGTASSTNVVTFAQSPANVDSDDLTPLTPNGSWGTETYPAQGTLNTNAGVQFNVSTLGAKNLAVAYEVRGTGTASKYHRLQYTINGTDWIDYPTSSSVVSAGTGASVWTSFNYSLAGFPGAANNANFGIRMVAEFESTASYGATNDAQYVAVGTTATYGTGGTLSYDLVTISADAITNANQPPTISALANVSLIDNYYATNNFTVSDVPTPAGSLVVTATCLDPTVAGSLTLTPVNTSGTCKLIMHSTLGNQAPVVVPILVTVKDGSQDSTAAWFYLTITPANAPPLINGMINTNMLGNTTLTIPFTLADDHSDMTAVTPTVSSGNTTLVPNGNLVLGGAGTTNRTLAITPAANQYGNVPITVSVGDGTWTTLRTIYVQVRKNANIVLVDNFNYDGGGAIDTVSGGLWSQYSGTLNQMQAGSGVVTVSGNQSEDVEAPLIGAPYLMSSATVLYSKFYLNYSTLPGVGGSYFAYFTDGSTSNFLCRVWAFTNGAASGSYRIGIATTTNTAAASTPITTDLSPGTSYLVVTRLVLNTAAATIWLNPVSESSASVTAADPNFSSATQITDYDLRESTAVEGIMTISNLVIATTFNDAVGVSPADVSVVKTGPGYVFANSNLTYTITVSNAGPASASGVLATDSLPVSVTFVSASGGGTYSGGLVTWPIGTLAINTASNLTVTVTAPASGSLTNKATVGSTAADSNSANNTSSLVITSVAPLPVAGPIAAVAGGNATISWNAVAGPTYSILWSTNVDGPYVQIATGQTSSPYIDTAHNNQPIGFYIIRSP